MIYLGSYNNYCAILEDPGAVGGDKHKSLNRREKIRAKKVKKEKMKSSSSSS